LVSAAASLLRKSGNSRWPMYSRQSGLNSRPASDESPAGNRRAFLFCVASRCGACERLFPLQRAAVEGRNHRLHVAVVRDVGVRSAIWFGEEWRGRDPLRGKRAIDGGGVLRLEVNSL